MTFYKICTTESLTVNTDLEIHAMHMRRRFNPIELCMSMRISYKLFSPIPFLSRWSSKISECNLAPEESRCIGEKQPPARSFVVAVATPSDVVLKLGRSTLSLIPEVANKLRLLSSGS